MLKSAPSALRNLHFPRPQAGARRECRSEETHPPEEEGRAGPGGWGMHRAPSSGRGVSGRPAPCLPRWEEEGWSRTGATTSNAPEYQGTAVRAFSSAPQRCPGQALALHVRLHALLESLAVVRVLGGVGESRGSGILANGVICLIRGPLQARRRGLGVAQSVGGVPCCPGEGMGIELLIVLVGQLAGGVGASWGSRTWGCGLRAVVRGRGPAVGVELGIAAGVGEAGRGAAVEAGRAGGTVVSIEHCPGRRAVFVGTHIVVAIGGILGGNERRGWSRGVSLGGRVSSHHGPLGLLLWLCPGFSANSSPPPVSSITC